MSILSRKKKTVSKFKSDVVLGERYIDKQTGFEGVATSVYFFQFACERVNLEAYDTATRQIRNEVFDAPRLTSVTTGKTATVDKTGGPGDGVGPRRDIAAR